ncbi:lipoxygenase homology domain-containing protein 1 [Cololabis saira]|uniref:lipoxygenase homology domain-containing protein 1 n=1 Tax=Cololabis saira TaxID=129043 RepID=UPI002AD39DD6|nr:lipoxygenase homology domain-containing protein 1 [Cololabis saira]
MGSKDKNKKGGEQAAGDDNEGTKKKKDKKKKSSVRDDSDEDNKKTKGKKKKIENYVEIYERELRDYEPEQTENHEDEYHKKKVYEVVTITGDERGAGTDANVFVTLFGEFGITPKLHLASKSRTAFEKAKTDVFRIRTHNVGPLKKIRIEHDNTGMSASWFLDRVVVTDVNRPHLRFYFSCNNWLSKDEGDGSYVRDLLGSMDSTEIPRYNKYLVTVFTADIKGSGTDADVFINIFGEFGDTGERRLNNDKNNFEKGTEDKFTIEAPNLGKIRKLTIGHNNRGSSAGWFADKVIVDDMGNKIVYEFPINRWFATDEDDGKIQRDILVGGNQPTGIVYNVQVVTGNIRGAGTNSKIHIVMHGTKGLKNSGKVFLEGGSFERDLTDIFNVEIAALLSPMSRVTIGHDNEGVSAGWYCEKVVVYCPFTGIEQTFPCGKWLDEKEGDGLIERELYEMVSLRQKRQKKNPWSLWIWTSDLPSAGTDADISFQVYGEKGKSDEIRLANKTDNFEQGQVDKFMVELPNLGKLTKLRIWHEKRNPFAGWHLSKVTLMKSLTKEKYTFPCERWLDMNEDDNEVVRELPATGELIDETLPLVKYRVTVCTGTVGGSGTDASVYLNLIGDRGDTGERLLVNCKNNVNKFEKGNFDEFIVEAGAIGQIHRVRIGHNGKGGGCGWFLDKVIVREGQAEANAVEFPCNRWLDRNEDDGQIVRELVPFSDGQRLYNYSYHVAVKTGNIPGGSSDSNVFVKLYGEKGDTSKTMLVVSANNLGNYFESGRVDIFTLDTFDIGQINRLLIGHTNEGMNAGWFLDSVQILVPVHGKNYMFPSHRWLCKDKADGKTEVEIYPSEILDMEKLINYEILVLTGDVMFAGTNAKVFIQIYGDNGKTEVITLQSRSNNFERNTVEIFKIEAKDVGKIFKIRIGHDGSGIGSGWYLEFVDVKRLIMALVPKEKKKKEDKKKKKKKKKDEEDEDEEGGEEMQQVVLTYHFPCSRWLAGGEEDGELVVELLPEDGEHLEGNTYEVCVFTGDILGAGTDANVYINIYGENGDTGERHLSDSDNLNKFERGEEDVFIVAAIDLGPLKKLRIRHDNTCSYLSWYLDRVEIVDTKEDLTPVFHQTNLILCFPVVPYEIKTYTSDVFGAGTDADVFIALYGVNGLCTQQKHLCVNRRERRLCFERGAEDMFIVELEDVGDVLEKIRIGHDNRGTNPGWHLDRVEIRRLLQKGKGSETTIFPCECWLAKSEDDGETVRELVPFSIVTQKLLRDGTLKTTETEVENPLEIHSYKVSVRTGDMYKAGTDANVYLTIYGDLGDTGERKLAKSETSKNKFERGQVDKFSMEAVDLGQVFKIRIRHNNSIGGADWYLDQVEVLDVDTEEVYMFLCERWLSTKKEDKQIDRTFFVKGYEGERNTDPYFTKMSQAKVGLDKNANKKKKKKKLAVVEEGPIIPYHFTVSTGTERDASTTARVFIFVMGPNEAETDRLWLDLAEGEKSFTAGSMKHFVCYGTDVGEIKRVELGHNGVTPESCWLVDELSVAVPTKGIKYIFQCKCWLAKDRGDGLTARLFSVLDSSSINIIRKVIYSATVVTGDTQYAGTDTNIFLTVYGANGSTEEMLLPKNGDRFERGQEDTFTLEIDDIAPLKKIRIRVDGSGSRPDWFLDRILMRNLTTEEVYLFTYENWLSSTMGQKRTKVCELPAVVDDEEMVQTTTYIIQVQTSDITGGGTDANVFLNVFGEYGDTGTLPLKESGNRNKFERKMKDVFRFPDMLSLGELSKVRVWHDNEGPTPGWHLEYIDVRDEAMDQTFRFPCDRWLAKNEEDRQIMRELACANNDTVDLSDKTKYEIATTTANTDDASTTENTWVALEGRKARSKEFVLENKKKKFLCGATDTFEFSSKHVGEIAGICIGHITKDGKKVKKEAFWHVMEVVVTEKELGNKYFFHCDAKIPLAAKKDQFLTFECYKSIESFASKVRSLVPVKYKIIIITGDVKWAGTDSNVFITIYGVNGDSGQRQMRQKMHNLFERGHAARFVLEMLDLGELLRVRVQHDGSGCTSGWYLECVEVTNTATSVTTIFPCGNWLDAQKADGQIQRVLYPRY